MEGDASSGLAIECAALVARTAARGIVGRRMVEQQSAQLSRSIPATMANVQANASAHEAPAMGCWGSSKAGRRAEGCGGGEAELARSDELTEPTDRAEKGAQAFATSRPHPTSHVHARSSDRVVGCRVRLSALQRTKARLETGRSRCPHLARRGLGQARLAAASLARTCVLEAGQHGHVLPESELTWTF